MSRGQIYAGKAAILLTVQDAVDQGLRGVRNKLFRFSNSLGALGGAMFAGGVLGSIASGRMIKGFADFSDELLNLQVKLGYFGKLTVEQQQNMDLLENKIRHLGRTTSFTAMEVAQAATELAQAGFSVREINDSLEATLDLARGAGYGLADSAAMMANAMRTFNIPTQKASEVISQFVRATRLGTIGIEDLREALKYASGTAFNLEQTLPTVLGFMVQLSESGLKGSLAGTSLNVAMLNMIKNLEKMQGLVPGFQLQFDNTGAFDFTRSLQELFRLTKNFSTIQRTQTFGDIFNIRGARAVSSVQEIERVMSFINQIAGAGNEGRLASLTRDSGVGGAIRRATSAFDDLGKTIGKIVAPAFKGLAEAVAPALAVIDRLATQMPLLVGAVVAAPFAIAAMGAGLLGVAFAGRQAGAAIGVLLDVWKSLAGAAVRGTAGQLGMLGLGRYGGLLGPAGRRPGARSGARAPLTAWQAFKRGGLGRSVLGVGSIGTGIAQIFSARQGIGTARSGALITRGLRNISIGFRGLASSLLGFIRVSARFAFSWTGVWTALEFLLLFGNKIPFIAAGFERLGKGFSRAFGEIGKIGSLAAGPIKLFFDSLGLLSAGNGQFATQGFEGMVFAVRAMAGIIGNQLVAAWQRVVYAIAPVYDFFRKILETLISIVGMAISMASGVIAGRMKDVFSLFQMGGEGAGWNEFFKKVAQWGAWFIGSFFNIIDKMGLYFDKFIFYINNWLIAIKEIFRPGWMGGDAERNFNAAQYGLASTGYDNRRIARQLEFEKVWDDIERIFKQDTAAGATKAGNAARNRALDWSGAAEEARGFINQLKNALGITATEAGTMTGLSPARKQMQQMTQSRRFIADVVDSVIGSAHETRNQLLIKGMSQEDYLKKQTDLLESIDEGIDDLNGKEPAF